MGFKETLMNLADKVGDTVDKGINKGKESYNKMAEKARVNKEIKTLNTEIDAILLSVGRKLFAENSENEQFKAEFGEVTLKESELEKLKKQLEVLESGADPCPSCGAAVQKDAVTCGSCGEKLVEEPQSAEAEVVEAVPVKTCANCGAEIDESAKFCNQCGTKVTD